MTDWESLSRQLKALGVELGKDKKPSKARTEKYPIERVVDGQFWDSIYGQVFCHQEHFPHDYLHGEKPLWPTHPIATLCQWADANSLSRADLENFIFLDTETSGLAGGTGTYAFEIGVGRFTSDTFHLAQFFMRHPGEEPALLAALSEFINGMQAIVTYNGKSFDVPLLNTRFTMMGMTSPFEEVDHFDLLPLARRLWRNRLESRTLGFVEENILGVKRGDEEVPGYLIPEMYFEFLKSQDARPMAGIFYHNAIDIFSLAGLFSHMAFLLEIPHTETIEHPQDIAAIGRLFEAMGNMTQALKLYEKALGEDLPKAVYWDTLERYSFLLKRNGNWHEAIAQWEHAAQAGQMYAFEELAKYFEHHAKDLNLAHDWTSRAIQALKTKHIPAYQYQNWKTSLEYRLDRLDRKLARQ